MDTREQKIEKLKEYFTKRNDVVMAFLFGSQAKGYARAVSDWDVGVYFDSEKENREQEQDVWSAIEKIVERNTDLVVLNRAPTALSWEIIRAGIPLAINDRKRYLQVLLKTSHEASSWFRTATDYHRIFERSASLSEADRLRLVKILQFTEQEIKEFETFKSLSWQEYANEKSKVQKRNVERWVEQLMNAVIDAAEVILASERRVIPETYREMVRTLCLIEPFDQSGDLCERISRLTEMRNLLAHEYLDYRWKEISAFIAETEPILRAFIGHVQKFLQMQKQK